jgi:hypothetical protein
MRSSGLFYPLRLGWFPASVVAVGGGADAWTAGLPGPPRAAGNPARTLAARAGTPRCPILRPGSKWSVRPATAEPLDKRAAAQPSPEA